MEEKLEDRAETPPKMILNYLFMRAVAENNMRYVRSLLELGVNVNEDGGFGLLSAVLNGDHEMASLLLDHGADIHAGDNGPLRLAAENDDTEMVTILMKYGAGD